MSLMTREDMLRELELLPVWQLRDPLPFQPKLLPIVVETPSIVLQAELPSLTTAEVLPVNVAQITVEPSAIQARELEETTQAEPLAITPEVMSQQFSYITSDNGDWLFVLPNTALQTDEAQLLHNIFMAMHIKAMPTEASSNLADIINTIQPKALITMGETTVQSVLQSTEALSNLRGRLHQFKGIPLVATYDLGHLLQALPDKAKAWDDMCLAMKALQTLK